MIKGLSLRNFMSYDDAFIPLEPGLNLICGPNGAGKSSILLAVSVVLGQVYTERARRLSDLIRWGQEQARVTLHLDNSDAKSVRPFPRINSDTVTVTRVIRKNGDHAYLLQDRPIAKNDVIEVFHKLGLNPDNMLIIMHQLMVGRFAGISAVDKLRLLEEAVGFQSYRADILEAHQRLRKVQSEEESLAGILQSTKETSEYWRREYEKFLKKKEFHSKLEQVQRELLWAKIAKRELSIRNVESRIDMRKRSLEGAIERMTKVKESLLKREERFTEVRAKNDEMIRQLIQATRDEAALQEQVASMRLRLHEAREETQLLQNALPREPKDEQKPYSEFLQTRLDTWMKKTTESENAMEKAEQELSRKMARRQSIEEELARVRERINDELGRVIDVKVESQVLDFKKKSIEEEMSDLEIQLKIAKEELEPLLAEAAKLGPRIENPRKLLELTLEKTAIDEQLKPLAHLSDDVERMYFSYDSVFKELREKSETVAKNREDVVQELTKRMDKWREVLDSFLGGLNERYNEILTQVLAAGDIRVTSAKDIEKCGLEITVGFKGAKPTPLDSYSQSGGERSVALMAFLLALQQNITSPLRAIDEFDVHLDPKNRETITSLIVSSSKAMKGEQYIAITPGQISVPSPDTHVIVVQNVGGASQVSKL